MKDDWVKHSKEAESEGGESEASKSIQRKVEQNEVNENSCSTNTKPLAVFDSMKGKDGNNKVSRKIRVSKRYKVAPSLIGLIRIEIISEADMIALIRSLKRSKSSKKNTSKGKSSKTSSKTSSCMKNVASLSAGLGPSANSKDWKNWVALHGDEKIVEEYIIDVGESIGVRCNNSFQVLSRGGVRGGSEASGEVRGLMFMRRARVGGVRFCGML